MIGHSLCSFGDGGYIGGNIVENTTLTAADNPVTVFDIVTVQEGVTLTIEPGTVLNFMPGTHIESLGILIIRGTLLNPVKCKLVDQPGVPGTWNGIKFTNSKTIRDQEGQYVSGSLLEHIIIIEAFTGISVSDSSNILIKNVAIQDCQLNGIFVSAHSNLTISDIDITNSQSGIAMSDSSFVSMKNLLVDGCGYGIKVENGSKIALSESAITQCGYGISFKASSYSRINDCEITNCVFGIMFFSDPDNFTDSNIIENNHLSYNDNVALFMSPGYSKIRYNIIRDNIISHNNIGLHIGNGGLDDNGFNLIKGNQVFDNEFGIKISQSNDSIKYNVVMQNKIGIILNSASKNSLYGNLLKQNTEWALLIEEGSNKNVIEYNNIAENVSAVKVSYKNGVPSVDNEFRFNSLSENTVTNFLFLSGPQSEIEYNRIVSSNDTASFINQSLTDINAINNYWGTTDTLVIDSMISDKHDYPQFGEVIYKPFDGSPHTDTPISKPRMAIKRLINNNVVVSWCSNKERDLAGYNIYLGDDNSFLTNTGFDTTFTIPGIPLTEQISITAYDSVADGFLDKFEGHESYFSYAVAGPYAGGVSSVCGGSNYFTSSATAIDFQSLQWSTAGDGTFVDASILHTYYVPGEDDKLLGIVNLKLEVLTTSGLWIKDSLDLEILEYLIVEAGPDTSMINAVIYNTGQAFADNYMELLWITSGDGVFEQADTLVTNYIPGESDKETGSVVLTLRITSDCGVVSDDVILQIIRGYNISGTVYEDNSTLNGAVILAYNKSEDLTRAVSITTSGLDGKFIISDIAEGNYYLHVIPDPQTNVEFLPTYYASCTKWQEAWLMPLYNDVYDVDIRLLPVDAVLPGGAGSISGSYLYNGKAGSDISVFNQPWFVYTSDEYYNTPEVEVPACNHLVMLMNPTLSRIIGWTLSDQEGNFKFTNLPYGEYRLWGEKAGFTNKVSNIISITPGNENINDVGLQVDVNNKVIETTLKEIKPGKILIYPNPASDYLIVNVPNLTEESTIVVQLINSNGVGVLDKSVAANSDESFGPIDISSLVKGLYFCIITTSSGYKITSKVAIN